MHVDILTDKCFIRIVPNDSLVTIDDIIKPLLWQLYINQEIKEIRIQKDFGDEK